MTLQPIGELAEVRNFREYLLSKIPGTEIEMTLEENGDDYFRWGFGMEGIKQNFFEEVVLRETNKFFKTCPVTHTADGEDAKITVFIDFPVPLFANMVWGSSTGGVMDKIGDDIGEWLIENIPYEMLIKMQPHWEKEYQRLQAAQKGEDEPEEATE